LSIAWGVIAGWARRCGEFVCVALAGAAILLAAMLCQSVLSFGRRKTAKEGREMLRQIALVVAVALAVAVPCFESPAFEIAGVQGGGDDPVVLEPVRGVPSGDMFPNHDSDYIIVGLTENAYGDNQAFPNGYYFKYASFNSDGTKLALSARNKVGGVSQPNEVWVMDYAAATQTISNFQKITSTGGVGGVTENIQVSWSRSNPDLLMFLEVHATTSNLVKSYDVSTASFATIYDPSLDTNGLDATNPAFLGGYDDRIVVGTAYGSGHDKIVVFDGTYPSTTISCDDQNLDPASNYAGDRVTYYSTQADYAQGSIYSQYSAGTWTENQAGFGDPALRTVPGYWACYSGKPDDMIMAIRSELGWSANGLGLYDSAGLLVSDLLGTGGTNFKYAYGNHNWEGPAGEVLFRAEEYTHAGYGNNIFIAMAHPDEVWVDDSWTGPNDCGGHAWGYDAFATVGEAVDVVTAGGTVHVAGGTYTDHVVLDKAVSLIGPNAGIDPNTATRVAEATIQTDDLTNHQAVLIQSPDVTVDGFTLYGPNGTTKDIGAVGLSGAGPRTNVHVQYNRIFRTAGGSDWNCDGVRFDPPSDAAASIYIEHNRVQVGTTQPEGNNDISIADHGYRIAHGGTWTVGAPDRVIIRQNYLYGHGKMYIEGIGVLVDRNVFSGIWGPIEVRGAKDVVISRNQMANQYDIGVFAWSPATASGHGLCTDVVISGNTITGTHLDPQNFTDEGTAIVLGGVTNATVVNNVLSGNAGSGVVVGGIGYDHFYPEDIGWGGGLDCGYDPVNNVIQGSDLSGNANLGVRVTAAVLETVNGSGNWWGTTDAAQVKAAANGGLRLDYTPWLGGGTVLSPGFEGDYSALWVDDDSPQTGTAGRVQEGVDLVSGSTVTVLPGTYNEGVTIGTSVVLTGDRGDVNVAGPGPSAPVMDGTGLSGVAAFKLLVGVSNVTIEGFEIRNYGPDDNTDADGIVAWNAGTSNVTIRDNWFHHLGWNGVLAGNEGQGTHTNWLVTRNRADHWYAYGLEITNTGSSSVTYNELSSPTSAWSFGILSYAYVEGARTVNASGITIDHNTISSFPDRAIYVEAFAVDATSTATMDGVAITNNTINGSFNMITAWATGSGAYALRNMTITDNAMTVTNPKSNGYAMHLTDIGGVNTCSRNMLAVSGAMGGGGTFFHGLNIGGPGTGTWTLDSNRVSGGGVGTASAGVRLRSTLPATAVVDVSGTSIDGWTKGVQSDALPTGAAVSFEYTNLAGNSTYGIENGAGAEIDAEHCWWGAASGPSGVGPGTGVPVSTGVDYDPWIGKAGGENVVCDPDLLVLKVGSTTGQVAVKYLGGGGGLVYGYSVKFSWDGAKVSTSTLNVTQGTLLSSAGPTTFLKYASGANEITVDCALMGAIDGVTGPGTMFTVDFTGVAYGESPVNVTLVKFRDRNNVPLSGFYEDDGLIKVDLTNPSVTLVQLANLTLAHTDDYAKNHDNLELTATVTDDYPLAASDITADLSLLLVGGGTAVPAQSYVGGVATWTSALANVTLTADGSHNVTVTATDGLGNTGSGSDGIIVDNTLPSSVAGFAAAPGHQKVHLSWSDASGNDTNYYGVLVRYDAWGDYPEYDTPAPVYPGSPTTGDGDAFSGTGTTATHAIVPPDIHYYSAFVYDWALNYSAAASGGQDRATNYWLGDVANGWASWGYDGLVNVNDINWLGGEYGQAPTGNYNRCDVGPTDDHSRLGIPLPNDFVDFEDLMIFAMNYGVVSPTGKVVVPFLPEPADEALALSLAEAGVTPTGDIEVALRLEGNAGEVKGLSAVVTFDPSQLEFVSARLSEEMTSPLADVFFWSGSTEGKAQVDLAVLGTGVTIGGSGEVAVLTFRTLGGEYALGFGDVLVRGAENEELGADVEGYESRPEVPTVFRLAQNVPNPFNPKTVVAYEVPQSSEVTIQVYDVTGRLVRTLVDGAVQPGRYAVEWDGVSDSGESVGSGVYFCVMETPEYHATHKMMLLK